MSRASILVPGAAVGIFIAVVVGLMHYVAPSSSSFDEYSTLCVAIASTVANVEILRFHHSYPPHPKFSLLHVRKLAIRAHVLSGTAEIVISILGFVHLAYFGSTFPYGYLQAVCAAIHIPTAVFQTPCVFGAKIVMLPSYYAVELIRTYWAIRSVLAPTDPKAILLSYLALCIYTWCRVWIKFMLDLNFARGNEYTLGIFLAGLTIVPTLAGPAAILITLSCFAMLGYGTLSYNRLDPYDRRYTVLMIENAREGTLTAAARSSWAVGASADDKDADRAAAQCMFTQMDKDNSGRLDREEVLALAEKFALTDAAARALDLAVTNEGGFMGFESFYRRIWRMADLTAPKRSTARVTTDEQRARLVFDSIDGDGSGYIDRVELARLLSGWGCVDGEVDMFLAAHDVDGDGRFSFQEFNERMGPIWRFCFFTFQEQERVQKRLAAEHVRELLEAKLSDGKAPASRRHSIVQVNVPVVGAGLSSKVAPALNSEII